VTRPGALVLGALLMSCAPQKPPDSFWGPNGMPDTWWGIPTRRFCQTIGHRLVIDFEDANITPEEVTALLEPHGAWVATCEPQTYCWHDGLPPDWQPQPYHAIGVLVQLPPSRWGCFEPFAPDDEVLQAATRRIQWAAPRPDCSCDGGWYSGHSIYPAGEEPGAH